MGDYIAEAITEAFGERCPDFAEGCACCEAWQQYDMLREVERSIREAYEAARYVPGDHPVVPVKIDAFMKACARALSEREGQE